MFKRIAGNAVFLSFSQLIARGIGFLYFIFLARVLGVFSFGIYTLTLSFIYNFVPVADFGLERFVLRDVSRNPEKTEYYFSRLLPLRVLLGIGAYIVALLLGIILGQPLKQLVYFAIFGLALVPLNVTFLITSFLNAKEKMKYMAGANIALILMTAGFGTLFVFLKLGLIYLLFSYPLSCFLLALFFLLNSSRWGIKLGWKIDKNFWKEAISQSWVFAVLLILAVFYLRLSIVIIGLLKGAEATGLYSSAFKFIEAGILIPQSLALAIFPVSSRLFIEDKTKLLRLYSKAFLFLLVLSLPFSLFLIVFPEMLVKFAYGVSYLPAVPVFSILGISLVLFFINSIAGSIIQNSSRVKEFLPFAAANFIIALILCLFLIPKYSIIGAAWAVVGGELAGLVFNNYFVWKILRERDRDQ